MYCVVRVQPWRAGEDARAHDVLRVLAEKSFDGAPRVNLVTQPGEGLERTAPLHASTSLRVTGTSCSLCPGNLVVRLPCTLFITHG